MLLEGGSGMHEIRLQRAAAGVLFKVDGECLIVNECGTSFSEHLLYDTFRSQYVVKSRSHA